MKNIQIIDGAMNGSFSVYAVPDHVFKRFFPERGQDIEFLEDVVLRLGKQRAGELMKHTWDSRQQKRQIKGIHGTLFIDMKNRKIFYPNKKESDFDSLEIQKAGLKKVAKDYGKSNKCQ